jgi:hypothetical protein
MKKLIGPVEGVLAQEASKATAAAAEARTRSLRMDGSFRWWCGAARITRERVFSILRVFPTLPARQLFLAKGPLDSRV